MRAEYVQKGENITYINAGDKDIKFGEVIVIGDRIAVAATDIKTGETGELFLTGAFEMAKVSGTAIATGKEVYYNATEDCIVTTKTGNVYAGVAIKDTLAEEVVAVIKID